MLKETFSVIFKHRAHLGIFLLLGTQERRKDNFFHSCSSVHVPGSCFLSVVSLVSSQSRRDGDVCASINKSNWHLVAFTIIIFASLSSFSASSFCVLLVVCVHWRRPSSNMVAFSGMSHINYSTGNFLTPVSFSLSRYFKVIWAVDPSLSKKRRRNKDWWKTSFPDFRINTACWVDRQQQGEMFHVCNSHASCHKNIGRARQRSTLCSMASLKCWISWKALDFDCFSCPSNCHFFLDCECW